LAHVGAGELERVEKESGALVIQAAVEDGLHDLLKGDLDGVGIFEKRQLESGVGFLRNGSADAIMAATASASFVMPVTEIGIAHGNGVADFAIGKNVRALLLFVPHKMENRALGAVYPLPLYFPVKI